MIPEPSHTNNFQQSTYVVRFENVLFDILTNFKFPVTKIHVGFPSGYAPLIQILSRKSSYFSTSFQNNYLTFVFKFFGIQMLK